MHYLHLLTILFSLPCLILAQCGSGTPSARVTSSGSTFTAVRGSSTLYSGADYLTAIQTALDALTSGQRLSVIASGSIGAGTITVGPNRIFEVCGTLNALFRSGRGAIESTNTAGVQIPYLTMTGNPYFGLRFSGTTDLVLGQITMNLSGGLGVRFDRDAARNTNTKMGVIRITGASSTAVEVWNIDGLTIDSVYARDIGEAGLLIQASTNVAVGYVEGNNVGAGTGYGTLRFANRNGRNAKGNYNTNVWVDKVYSRGGGRGVFCVSESGGAVIKTVDLADNGNNAILIENCYNVSIRGGTVNGGGEVRLAARTEFAGNRDIWITLKVDGTSVRESPCGDNTNWTLTGNGARDICA